MLMNSTALNGSQIQYRTHMPAQSGGGASKDSPKVGKLYRLGVFIEA